MLFNHVTLDDFAFWQRLLLSNAFLYSVFDIPHLIKVSSLGKSRYPTARQSGRKSPNPVPRLPVGYERYWHAIFLPAASRP